MDMTASIAPKSDQLNFDDFSAGRSITIKITKVTGTVGDQPVSIHYEGDAGKPYKPCKSMRRVLVNCWGKFADQYVGRSITLYGDQKVIFGGLAVGGIRISHMSHIDKDITMALTATRANRKPYTVKPIKEEAEDVESLEMQATEAASKGTLVLKSFWDKLPASQQKLLKKTVDELKHVAAGADVIVNGGPHEETQI